MSMMNKIFAEKDIEISALYARCVETSKRINWDLEENERNSRIFHASRNFLDNTHYGIKE